jgi:hypothetical protein
MVTHKLGSAEAAAKAIQAVSELSLTVRPYNRFEPLSTLWWLVPSIEWPAFRFGKLFFEALNSVADNRDSLYCGFSIEKGLSGAATAFYPSNLLIDSRWTWQRLVGDSIEEFPNFPGQMRLDVAASYINRGKAGECANPESFLAQKRTFSPNRASFVLSQDGRLSSTQFSANENNPDVCAYFRSSVNTAQNVPELIAALRQMPQADWVWIDFFAGSVIGVEELTANADGFWRSCLRPWIPWLR